LSDYDDVSALRAALADGLDLNERGRSKDGETLFARITRLANPRSNKVLVAAIDAGADVNARDDGGITPLHWGMGNMNSEGVRVLLKAGADPDAADAYGRTPLHWACDQKYSGEDIRKGEALIEAAANVGVRDREGKTPLHYAAAYQDAAMVRMLIDAGADVNALDKHSMTPLHHACRNHDPRVVDTVKVLIEAGADAGLRDRDGDTPRDVARDVGQNHVVVNYLKGLAQEGGE
jgi:cytohesin